MIPGDYEALLDLYPVEFGMWPMPFEEFLDELEPDVPAFPFAVASVDRNMFRNSARVAAIRAGLNPFHPRITAAIDRKLAAVPITNFSGD
jgi:hypothetical protein